MLRVHILRLICNLAVVFGMNSVAVGQIILAENHFDADAEGWTVVRTPTFVPVAESFTTWQATGGNPDGYLRHVDPNDSQISLWSAPASYLGDKSGAYGGTLSFDLAQNLTSSNTNYDDVILIGNGGVRLSYDVTYPPLTTWTNYQVALVEGNWHVGLVNGPIATATELYDVLSSLTALYIRAEYRSGADTDSLDNVVLATFDPCPASEFNTSAEGWWTINDASNERWEPGFGNPPGSFEATDLVDGSLWHYLAPGKFLGNRTVNMGGTVEFDLYTTSVDATLGDQIITLTGGGGVLRYQTSDLPVSGAWKHYSVPLLPSPEWKLNDGVTQATDNDFLLVLGSLRQFLIRGEYWSGPDVGRLDNVRFTFCHVCQLPGDVDESGDVDLLDLPIFVDAVIGLPVTDAQRRCSDVNQDFRVDGRDVVAIVEAMPLP